MYIQQQVRSKVRIDQLEAIESEKMDWLTRDPALLPLIGKAHAPILPRSRIQSLEFYDQSIVHPLSFSLSLSLSLSFLAENFETSIAIDVKKPSFFFPLTFKGNS